MLPVTVARSSSDYNAMRYSGGSRNRWKGGAIGGVGPPPHRGFGAAPPAGVQGAEPPLGVWGQSPPEDEV